MRYRKISSIALGFAVATMALAGCGSDGGGGAVSEDPDESQSEGNADTSTPEGDLSVAIVSKGYQQQFWQAVKLGADQAAEELGVTVTYEGPDTESDVEQQVQMLQSALDRSPDAIGFAALDTQAAVPMLEQTVADGIPVIAFDSGVESDIPVTTVGTDNRAAAAEAAKQMAEQLNHKGKVALVAHNQTASTAIDRRDGFTDYLEENEPDIEVVDVQYGESDLAKSADITKAMIAAHPDLNGIYAQNEGCSTGMVAGYKELGLQPGDMVLIGFDSGKAQLDAIKEGYIYGSVTQNPIGIGYETVKAAIAAIKGETLPKEIDSGFFFYTKDNMDDSDIAAVLYE